MANISTPVNARSSHSERCFGNRRTRPSDTATSTTTAITNRIATNEIGGKSRNPTLIASQVELQITHSAANAATTGSFR